MPKTRKKLDPHGLGQKQMGLFERLVEAARAPERATEEGALEVSARLRASLNEAFKGCPLSRHQVAGEMSHLTGREITKAMLDSWTAESKEGHRFPAELLPAFCKATGCRKPVEILAEAAGCFALPGPDALRAEIQRLKEEEKKIRARMRQRETFLKEMEGDR